MHFDFADSSPFKLIIVSDLKPQLIFSSICCVHACAITHRIASICLSTCRVANVRAVLIRRM
jgi:hypothetical protein